jgi:hypothetical protein
LLYLKLYQELFIILEKITSPKAKLLLVLEASIQKQQHLSAFWYS